MSVFGGAQPGLRQEVLALLHVPKAGGSTAAAIMMSVMASRGCYYVSGHDGAIRTPPTPNEGVELNPNKWRLVARSMATAAPTINRFYEPLPSPYKTCFANSSDGLQSYVNVLQSTPASCFILTASPGRSSAHCWPYAVHVHPELAPKLGALVGGHGSVGFCTGVLRAACKFVVVMRHPVDRLISAHNYFVLSDQATPGAMFASVANETQKQELIQQYFEQRNQQRNQSPSVLKMLQNVMQQPERATDALRYFESTQPGASDTIATRIARSKKLMDTFSVVGVSDRMDDFQALMALKFGMRTYVCAPERTTSLMVTSLAPRRHQDLPTEVAYNLERFLAPDVDLFRHAELRMQQLVEEAGVEFVLARRRLDDYCQRGMTHAP